jgi:methylenetetrahydrofolate reductase (NADPH)
VEKPVARDRKLTDLWKEKRFTVSAEILPPDDTHSLESTLDQCHELHRAGCDFFSVADGPAGTPRGGTKETVGAILSDLQTPVLPHLICRRRTPSELGAFLQHYSSEGAKQVLVLRGDPPADAPNWKFGQDGTYRFAYELVEQAKREAPELEIGVACYPDAENTDLNLKYFEKKVRAGASFAVTQLLYSAVSYARFIEAIASRGCGIPVLPGVLIPHSQAHAEKLRERFNVEVPQELLKRLAFDSEDPDADEASREAVAGLIETLKIRGAPGVHLYVLRETARAARLVEAVRHSNR